MKKQYSKQMIQDYAGLKKHIDKTFHWLQERGINVAESPIDLLVSPYLDLSNCGLTEIPIEFKYLKNKVLDFSGNDLGDGSGLLPVCYMKCLSAIDLSYCNLSGFPIEFQKHKNFDQLNLAGNELTDIPEGVYMLEYIDFLNISNNPIKQISKKALLNIRSEWVVIDDENLQIPKEIPRKKIKIYYIQDKYVPIITLD